MSTGTSIRRQLNNLRNEGRNVVRGAPMGPVMENWLRLGFVVRGLIYAVIGVLAVQVAISRNGALTDPQGAIATLGKTPPGIAVLYAVLVGLIGYALWGVIRAIFDPLHRGTNAEGLAARAGYLVSAISYAFLAYSTYRLIMGTASSGGQTAQTQQITGSILSYSWGPWVVGIVGVILFGAGLIQFVQGMRSDFERQFDLYKLTPSQRRWMERLGRFGTAARGVVFALIGLFMFLAAYHHDPRQVQGIDGVLTTLLHQPYGPWLMGIVALGLVAFGIYSILSGVWLRFKR